MKSLFVNPACGVAGDMFTAALIDLGIDLIDFETQLNSLKFSKEELDWSISKVQKAGIDSLKFTVKQDQDLKHEQSHVHGHSHSHEHSHEHEHDHNHVHGRHLPEIIEIIKNSSINVYAKDLAITAFTHLAESEAKVHNKTINTVHFHEVGGIDAIADICGSCIAFSMLEIDEVICKSVALGGGHVHCDHGTMQVPVPAVCNLLVNVPCHTGPIEKELTTPTGAALLKTFVTKYSNKIEGNLITTGYGAGTRDLADRANVLTLQLFEATKSSMANHETISVISCTIDDQTPEQISYALDLLLKKELAIDAYITSASMKKSRMGHYITVLARPSLEKSCVDFILRQTSTFGVRVSQEKRTILERDFIMVSTAFGEVKIKRGLLNGEVLKAAPEYEDCKTIAEENKISIQDVFNAAQKAYNEKS
ncbi:MAG: nickel pincer cofactor biosynthesis protein LarC [Lentisphaeria bacterium]|nr:nickel pincer cofactor biosynthesis protein LarC [Lentisphaeria bacterium]